MALELREDDVSVVAIEVFHLKEVFLLHLSKRASDLLQLVYVSLLNVSSNLLVRIVGMRFLHHFLKVLLAISDHLALGDMCISYNGQVSDQDVDL